MAKKKEVEEVEVDPSPNSVVKIISCGHCGTKAKAVAKPEALVCDACRVKGKWEAV